MNRLVGDKIHLSAVSIYYFMCRLHFKFLLIVVVCKGSHNIKFLARFLGFLGFLSLALNGSAVYFRAALGITFLSAVTTLIGIVNLSNCASCRLKYYRMLPAGDFYF